MVPPQSGFQASGFRHRVSGFRKYSPTEPPPPIETSAAGWIDIHELRCETIPPSMNRKRASLVGFCPGACRSPRRVRPPASGNSFARTIHETPSTPGAGFDPGLPLPDAFAFPPHSLSPSSTADFDGGRSDIVPSPTPVIFRRSDSRVPADASRMIRFAPGVGKGAVRCPRPPPSPARVSPAGRRRTGEASRESPRIPVFMEHTPSRMLRG